MSSIKITWIGHACTKIEKDGYVIIIDPYGDGYVPGLAPVREEADLVLCTHQHGDHNAVDKVSLKNGGINPFKMTEIKTYHDDVKGAKRGRNSIFLFESEGFRVAHFGDLGCRPEPDQLALLSGLDAALIPVGGFYTIDGKQAADLVGEIKPGIVIPIHYADRKEKFGFDEIAEVGQFTKYMDQVKIREDSSLLIPAHSAGQDQGGQVIVLKPQNVI